MDIWSQVQGAPEYQEYVKALAQPTITSAFINATPTAPVTIFALPKHALDTYIQKYQQALSGQVPLPLLSVVLDKLIIKGKMINRSSVINSRHSHLQISPDLVMSVLNNVTKLNEVVVFENKDILAPNGIAYLIEKIPTSVI